MRDPVFKVGDQITCTAGHVIADVIKPLCVGDMNWHEAFGNWTQAPLLPGQLSKPNCAVCGQPFIAEYGWGLHTPNGWVDPWKDAAKYEPKGMA